MLDGCANVPADLRQVLSASEESSIEAILRGVSDGAGEIGNPLQGGKEAVVV